MFFVLAAEKPYITAYSTVKNRYRALQSVVMMAHIEFTESYRIGATVEERKGIQLATMGHG